MTTGVPGGLLFYRYEPFIRGFFGELGVDVHYSVKSDKEILAMGQGACVNEACLPVKLFCGHVAALRKDHEQVLVPRMMNCEYGMELCPKIKGLPELVKGGAGMEDKLTCTGPLHVGDRERFVKELEKEAEKLGASAARVPEAVRAGAADWQRDRRRGLCDGQYRHRVMLVGHPYNLYDPFANLNLVEKLHRLDIGVLTGEAFPWHRKMGCCAPLIKQPYWGAFVENYGSAVLAWEERAVDGIIFVSSFCCGTDSFTVDMIRARLEEAPLLVLKVDEHRGEAGMDTRLQAFGEVLERRKSRAYVSAFR